MNPIATLPEVSAAVDDAPLSTSVLESLYQVRVQQELSLPDQCELAFSPLPAETNNEGQFAPGKSVDLWIGPQQELLFSGEITAVEYAYGPSHRTELRVRAYDRLHRLRKRQPVRTHVQVTARELAEELTSDLDVTVQAAEEGPLWDQIIQHRQSDFELLVEICRHCGLYPYLSADVLQLLTLRSTDRTVSLQRGRDLLEVEIEHNGETACRQVRAVGWDPLRVERRAGESTDARVDRPSAVEISADALGGSGRRYITGQTGPTDHHIVAATQAELDRRSAGEITLRGVAEGNPSLQPGTTVEVSGIAPVLEGRYGLTKTVHTIDGERGFLSEISSAVPPPIDFSEGMIATLGTVNRVDDPENIGRIKARLPAYDDLESPWLHVASPGAGARKGLTALPDIDDSVLILCADRNPGDGIVLGGLYGMDGPPDSGVEGNAVERYTFRTPGGQVVKLDDENHTLSLEDSSGSRIEFSPERVYLHAATDLEMEAPGQSVVIRGDNIDFQRG